MQIALAATTHRGTSRVGTHDAPFAAMHRDPKLDAQIVEEDAPKAEPDAAASVTNTDGGDEESREAAKAKAVELDRIAEASAARTTGPTVPPERATPLDRLDKERADGEGMTRST